MAYHKTTLKFKNKVLSLEELHLTKKTSRKINQLIEEFSYIDALQKFNIPVDNKIILHGHTGCGKTATANAIGKALNKKVITLNLGGFVSSKLGETGKNIADIFRSASYENAILFIDEFDFIGKTRDYDNKDSGEMKRLVNTLIQQIDNLADTAMLIGATNHIDIIDTALLRRFQIRLEYKLPSKQKLNTYYDSILANFPTNISNIKRIYNISYAEVKDVVYQQIKGNIITLEKHKTHLLFCVNPLKFKHPKLQNYNSKPLNEQAILTGYKLKETIIKNTDFSNTDNTYATLVKTEDNKDAINGFVFKVTGDELRKIDKHELPNCKRVLEITNTKLSVWVYIFD
ncbi:AAA family ATPase [Tenacibaculum aestuariivivum]|uniref:AAA family ATPase n=1 Tax=Tenacibaculum aestuariivivum TaxID=2006131 RepID=UPI003AB63B87